MRKKSGVVAFLAALALAAPAHADFSSSHYTYSSCGGGAVDPVNIVFYGSTAYASNAAAHMEHHSGWSNTSGSSQVFYTHGYCRGMSTQRASGTYSRYHLRFFQTYHRDAKGRYETVADAHHEDWIWYCGHAVDSNGPGGSGFDQGRWRVYDLLVTRHHWGGYQNWGNTRSFRQCDGDYAGSAGYVGWWGVGSV
jgi:hypothetical protein